MKQIHDPNRLLMVPSIPQTTLKLHHAPAGMLSLGTSDDALRVDPPSISFTGFSSGTSTSSTIAATQFIAGSSNAPAHIDLSAKEPASRTSYSGLSSGSSAPSVVAATQFIAGSSSSGVDDSRLEGEARVPGPQPLSHGETLHQLAKRKVGNGLQQSEPPPKKPRKGRTCRKCTIESCPGKATWKYCCNKCQDCGKEGQDKSCLGRNPKFPTKTCREAFGSSLFIGTSAALVYSVCIGAMMVGRTCRQRTKRGAACETCRRRWTRTA
ncbi:hypothetical protein B0H11DRAFT_2131492 [Mycena galericulata]|nr:hypothetical protein B0H11DRAFT_2131492 [Mycena galericulata]